MLQCSRTFCQYPERWGQARAVLQPQAICEGSVGMASLGSFAVPWSSSFQAASSNFQGGGVCKGKWSLSRGILSSQAEWKGTAEPSESAASLSRGEAEAHTEEETGRGHFDSSGVGFRD